MLSHKPEEETPIQALALDKLCDLWPVTLGNSRDLWASVTSQIGVVRIQPDNITRGQWKKPEVIYIPKTLKFLFSLSVSQIEDNDPTRGCEIKRKGQDYV